MEYREEKESNSVRVIDSGRESTFNLLEMFVEKKKNIGLVLKERKVVTPLTLGHVL